MATKNVNMKAFIAESRARLKKILTQLKWTEAGVLKALNPNKIECVVEKNEKHGIKALPPSCALKNSIRLRDDELQRLLDNDALQNPQTFDDVQANFSCEERLRIYELIIERTGHLTEPERNVVCIGEQSFAEIVAQKKSDRKKQRRYRTTKPTHNEELQALIELQMQAMQQYLKKQNDIDKQQQKSVISGSHSRSRYECPDSRSRQPRDESKRRAKRSHSRSASRDWKKIDYTADRAYKLDKNRDSDAKYKRHRHSRSRSRDDRARHAYKQRRKSRDRSTEYKSKHINRSRSRERDHHKHKSSRRDRSKSVDRYKRSNYY